METEELHRKSISRVKISSMTHSGVSLTVLRPFMMCSRVLLLAKSGYRRVKMQFLRAKDSRVGVITWGVDSMPSILFWILATSPPHTHTGSALKRLGHHLVPSA